MTAAGKDCCATDHSFGQARLKRLVDDAAAPAEIRLAADHESVERHLLGLATALRVQHSDHSAGMVQSFHFPDSSPAIAAVLLEHARDRCFESPDMVC